MPILAPIHTDSLVFTKAQTAVFTIKQQFPLLLLVPEKNIHLHPLQELVLLKNQSLVYRLRYRRALCCWALLIVAIHTVVAIQICILTLVR